MQTLWQDLRYGARVLMKKRIFVLIVVITLGLGVGANAAIFSVVDAVLLAPLPYTDPERLVAMHTALPDLGFPRVGLSDTEFVELRRQNQSFAELAGWNWDRATLRGRQEPERIIAPLATANLFRTLGVRIELGRDFTEEEEQVGKNQVAILSHRFWQRKFAGDPAIIGQVIELDGAPITIIGVLPDSFKSPPELQAGTSVDLWRGFDLNLSRPRRGSQYMSVIGRLHSGVTFETAQAEHHANTRRVANANPQWYPANISGFLVPLERSLVGDVRLALLILLAAVAVVLLIACANVANLLLARSEERQKEIAVRAALGASRLRLIRQLLIESTLLALLGGGFGLLLAYWGVDGLLAISPTDIPRLAETSLDLRVIGFALAVSLLTALLFGLAPALHAVKVDLHTMLKESGRTTGLPGRSRLRQALVVTETALAVVLLVAAGLLARSFWKLQNVEMGFRADHLLTLRLTPPGSAYADNQQVAGLYEKLLTRLQSLPGVASAAVTDPLPLTSNNDTVIEIEGRQLDMNRLTHMSVDFRTVSTDYFHTMGMRLTQGRGFTDGDQEGALPVTIINETLARNQWPGENPVGKRFRYLDGPPDQATTRYLTIVGVVADAKNHALDADPNQEAFIPLRQHAISYGRGGVQQAFHLAVRTLAEPVNLAAVVQREARDTEPNFVISQVKAMDELLASARLQPRFQTSLFAGFALLALGLGAVGIYGVIAYTVAQRTHEIGVRMALGAQTRQVWRLVIWQGLRPALLGIALGLAGAFAVTRIMERLLFAVSASDPLTFIAIAALLLGVALIACAIPEWRATKVDPMVALRYE